MGNDNKFRFQEQELRNISFKYLSIIRNMIFWIDPIDVNLNKNNAIFVRPFNDKNASPQQLTGKEFNVKSNFHGYGGKPYKCIDFKEYFYLIWIDQLSNSIWFQIFKIPEIIDNSKKRYLVSVQDQRQLSKTIKGNFDSSFVITEGNLLYGICEIENRDYLFSLNLERKNQEINKIKEFSNFAADLSSNTSANLLSWIEWDTPYMPWEKNDLFFAVVDTDGAIKKIKKFSNQMIDSYKSISFFQPYWISEKLLVCSEDS